MTFMSLVREPDSSTPLLLKLTFVQLPTDSNKNYNQQDPNAKKTMDHNSQQIVNRGLCRGAGMINIDMDIALIVADNFIQAQTS